MRLQTTGHLDGALLPNLEGARLPGADLATLWEGRSIGVEKRRVLSKYILYTLACINVLQWTSCLLLL